MCVLAEIINGPSGGNSEMGDGPDAGAIMTISLCVCVCVSCHSCVCHVCVCLARVSPCDRLGWSLRLNCGSFGRGLNCGSFGRGLELTPELCIYSFTMFYKKSQKV